MCPHNWSRLAHWLCRALLAKWAAILVYSLVRDINKSKKWRLTIVIANILFALFFFISIRHFHIELLGNCRIGSRFDVFLSQKVLSNGSKRLFSRLQVTSIQWQLEPRHIEFQIFYWTLQDFIDLSTWQQGEAYQSKQKYFLQFAWNDVWCMRRHVS